MSIVMQEWPRRHRITVEQYYRMAEVGLLAENEHTELIDGEIIDMPPMGSVHAGRATRIANLLSNALGSRVLVRQQMPIRLGDACEPQPDIAVVEPRDDCYESDHPTAADVLLLIEISDTTLRYDRDVKIPLYARHSIAEAWIVDLRAAQIHFHRAPVGGRYTEVFSVGELGIVMIAGLTVDLSG